MAFAQCVDDSTTAATGEATETQGIEKDGSRAPLETEARAETAGESESGPTQKDGGTMPLASSEAEDGNELATSQQDIEAQQEGEQTAAAAAQEDC